MKENGQKETEQETEPLKVSLRNLGTVNKNMVILSKGDHQISLYFSYETLVGINGIISVNDWSKTTGKLLNELQPDKSLRLPHDEVLKIAGEKIQALLMGGSK
jgi:hypothetical protein